MEMQKLPETSNQNIVILGAGVAGSLGALNLADKGIKVDLVEKKDELMGATSRINPGRWGLGFHYENQETALAYLHASIEFGKVYPPSKFAIGRDKPGGYLQRGRYFVVKNLPEQGIPSLFPKERVLATYEAIKQEYKRLCELDPSNMIFGDPEKIYRILDPSEYKNDVNMDIVDIGIETGECLLDVEFFRKHLIEKLRNNKNIRIHTNHTATQFDYDSESDKYVVTCSTAETKTLHKQVITQIITQKKFKADFVVNATWEFVEQVTQMAGLINGIPKDGRTNRLKVLAEVQLPESLRYMNSMFFCMGPHCMFSNMGDGRALMSYAPNTNVDMSNNVYVPPEIQLFTKEGLTEIEESLKRQILEKHQFGQKIIEGVAKYIPEMANAALMDLRFGIVKTTGTVDIFDPTSPFHFRNYSGVEGITLGWINNAAMKLLYGLNNSHLVYELILELLKIKAQLPGLLQKSFEERIPLSQQLSAQVIKREEWCDLYLMPRLQNETPKRSDRNHLYLYKDADKRLFYFAHDDKQYFLEGAFSEKLQTAEFSQPLAPDLIKYDDEKVCKDVIKITSERGHTNKRKIQLNKGPSQESNFAENRAVVVDQHMQTAIVKNMKRYFFFKDCADPKAIRQTTDTAINKVSLTKSIKSMPKPTLFPVASLDDIPSAWTNLEEPVTRIWSPKPQGCDLFLMPTPEIKAGYLQSDKNHLYLYKEQNNRFFYIVAEGTQYFLEEDVKGILQISEFVQPAAGLTKCDNERICNTVLKITSERGHTQPPRDSTPRRRADMLARTRSNSDLDKAIKKKTPLVMTHSETNLAPAVEVTETMSNRPSIRS